MHHKSATAILTASILLAACSTTPQKTNQAEPVPAPPNVASASGQASAAQSDGQIAKTLAAKSIYFDYDDYTLKPEYQTLLKADSDLLKSAKELSITVEGNADERGSHEYNLALGQKRAEAVRKALSIHGVPDTRMEAISYGKERPRSTCSEEKCWAENRRADIAAKPGTVSK